MKFYILENDGMSVKPFTLSIINAKDKTEAYDKYEELNNLGGFWIMTKQELNNLKEQLDEIN